MRSGITQRKPREWRGGIPGIVTQPFSLPTQLCYVSLVTVFQQLLLVFLLVPLAEIYLLIRVGSLVGAGTTIFLVVFTAVLGAFLVRSQGISTLSRVQASLGRNEIPALSLLEGAFILVAGALLLTPGFITDTIGFVFLVPPWRQRLVRWFMSRRGWEIHMGEGGHGGRVIEGEYTKEDDRPRAKR